MAPTSQPRLRIQVSSISFTQCTIATQPWNQTHRWNRCSRTQYRPRVVLRPTTSIGLFLVVDVVALGFPSSNLWPSTKRQSAVPQLTRSAHLRSTALIVHPSISANNCKQNHRRRLTLHLLLHLLLLRHSSDAFLSATSHTQSLVHVSLCCLPLSSLECCAMKSFPFIVLSELCSRSPLLAHGHTWHPQHDVSRHLIQSLSPTLLTCTHPGLPAPTSVLLHLDLQPL